MLASEGLCPMQLVSYVWFSAQLGNNRSVSVSAIHLFMLNDSCEVQGIKIHVRILWKILSANIFEIHLSYRRCPFACNLHSWEEDKHFCNTYFVIFSLCEGVSLAHHVTFWHGTALEFTFHPTVPSFNYTDDRGSSARFPAGAGNFSLHHRVQNGSGTHPATYPMGIRGSFPGGKVVGAWIWPLTEVKEWVELYINSPSTSSWHGA